MQFGILFVIGEMIFYTTSIYANTSDGYMGCYKDYNSDRILSGYWDLDMYVNGATYCKIVCMRKGYRYAGTEYSRECFCGNVLKWNTESSSCTRSCRRNWDEICGGSNAISIYDTWQCVTKPCQNGGNCTDFDVNSYLCSCSEQWTGRNCEEEVTTTTPTTTSTTATTTLTIVITTMPDTNTTSNTSSTYTYAGTTDEMKIVTYISITCGGLVVIVISLTVIYFLRRKQKKTSRINKEILQNLETPNNTLNTVDNGISAIDTGTASNRSTLYCNEHILMTSDGERVNIEFHSNQSNINNNDDYNTLSLSGMNGDSRADSNGWLRTKANRVDSTYSHLGEHVNNNVSSDTYSRLAYNKLNQRSHFCDSTYSHTRLGSTQSEAVENTTYLDSTYNTLNTLPKTKIKESNYSKFSNAMSENEDQIYCNVKNAEQDRMKEIDGLQGNKSSDLVKFKKDDSENYSMTKDNIYAKPVKRSNNRQNEDAQQLTDSLKPRCRRLEMFDESIEGNYDDNGEEACYYNVCSSSHEDAI